MHDRYARSILSSIEDRFRRWEDREDRGFPIGNDDSRILRRLIQLITEKIMPTLDETLAKVTEQGDRLDSLLAFVSGLKKQLEEALAGQMTPEMQAKIDAIFTEAEENRAKIDEALNVNVPPPPTP